MVCDPGTPTNLIGASNVGTLIFPSGVQTATTQLPFSSTSAPFDTSSCQVSLDALSMRGGATIDSSNNAFAFSLTDYGNNPFGVFGFTASSLAAVPAVLTPSNSFSLSVYRNVSGYETVVVSVTVVGDAGQQIVISPESGRLTFNGNQFMQTISVHVVAPIFPQPVTTVNIVLSINNTADGTEAANGVLGAAISSTTGVATHTLDAYGAPEGVFAMSTPSSTASVGTTVSVPVTRRGGTAGTVRVAYSISAGALGLQAPYVDVTGGVLVFQPGQSSGSVMIFINNTGTPALAQSVGGVEKDAVFLDLSSSQSLLFLHCSLPFIFISQFYDHIPFFI